MRLLAAGLGHTCVTVEDAPRDVRCWGRNDYDQVAPGGGDVSPGAARVHPFDDPVIALSAGSLSTCALLATGDVYCWGWDYLNPGTRTAPKRVAIVP